jgi:hypothetical protein
MNLTVCSNELASPREVRNCVSFRKRHFHFGRLASCDRFKIAQSTLIGCPIVSSETACEKNPFVRSRGV